MILAERHTGIEHIPFEEIVDQIGGVHLRSKPCREKQRQELGASDVQHSLARSCIKVLQDVSCLGTADVLAWQHQALQAGDRVRRQRTGTDRVPKQVEIQVCVSSGVLAGRIAALPGLRWRDGPLHASGRLRLACAIVGATNLPTSIEDDPE